MFYSVVGNRPIAKRVKISAEHAATAAAPKEKESRPPATNTEYDICTRYAFNFLDKLGNDIPPAIMTKINEALNEGLQELKKLNIN